MKFAISLFMLIAFLGISARQRTLRNTKPYIYVKKESIIKHGTLLKPSDSLMKALKEVEHKASICDKTVNKILKSQKDSVSLIANIRQ